MSITVKASGYDFKSGSDLAFNLRHGDSVWLYTDKAQYLYSIGDIHLEVQEQGNIVLHTKNIHDEKKVALTEKIPTSPVYLRFPGSPDTIDITEASAQRSISALSEGATFVYKDVAYKISKRRAHLWQHEVRLAWEIFVVKP